MLFGSGHATVVGLPPRSVVSPTRLVVRAGSLLPSGRVGNDASGRRWAGIIARHAAATFVNFAHGTLATRGVICARKGSVRLKKAGEQLSHPLRGSCFALPDYQDTPAFVLEAGAGGMITFDVTSQLRQPVVGIGGRLFATERTVMLMPEAAVYENDLAQAWKDKVGSAG